MGKYKEIDKTTISEAIIPPTTVTVKIENTETHESSTKTGWTYQEAREKAYEELTEKVNKK